MNKAFFAMMCVVSSFVYSSEHKSVDKKFGSKSAAPSPRSVFPTKSKIDFDTDPSSSPRSSHPVIDRVRSQSFGSSDSFLKSKFGKEENLTTDRLRRNSDNDGK